MPRLPPEPPASEITPEPLFSRRREFLKNTALFAGTSAVLGTGLVGLVGGGRAKRPPPKPLGLIPLRPGDPVMSPDHPMAPPPLSSATDPLTPYDAITTYNNYYELGLSKSAPSERAGTLKARPWTVTIEGEVKKPQRLDIDTLLGWFTPEERVYRMRCVETWSMVIPWLGFPLAALIKRVEPTSRAKYVAMTTLMDPEQLPGQKSDVLEWPYVEALRIDEAVHPLTMLAVGLYGKELPGQNGAPLRLVVPWKYGFKGVKSIVHIAFTEKQPRTTWNSANHREYGFYANVNPAVDHPRWSQANERRIGDVLRRATLPFNGYAESVADLYAGMDLRKDF